MFRLTDRDLFIALQTHALASRGDHAACVSLPCEDAVCFVSDDLRSGYALKGNELGAVWSDASVRGRFAAILQDAMTRLQDHWSSVRLDCFEFLVPLYTKHGFTEDERLTWDDDYAPEGWPESLGKPDVVIMSAPIL